MKSGGVHFKGVAFTRFPVGIQIILFQIQRIAHNVERDILPQRIHLLPYVQSSIIKARYRLCKTQCDIVVHIHGRRRIHIHRQKSSRLRFFLTLLPFFLLFLFGLLFLLLLLFLQLLPTYLRHDSQRIRPGN